MQTILPFRKAPSQFRVVLKVTLEYFGCISTADRKYFPSLAKND